MRRETLYFAPHDNKRRYVDNQYESGYCAHKIRQMASIWNNTPHLAYYSTFTNRFVSNRVGVSFGYELPSAICLPSDFLYAARNGLHGVTGIGIRNDIPRS